MWWFWRISERHDTFVTTFTSNGMFLLKWLSLAYVLEALMLRYVPADWIAGALGGTGLGTISLAALIGVPAYLNGYAAVPLVDALLSQGMSPGAAMSFIIAGGVSCIPATVAFGPWSSPRFCRLSGLCRHWRDVRRLKLASHCRLAGLISPRGPVTDLSRPHQIWSAPRD